MHIVLKLALFDFWGRKSPMSSILVVVHVQFLNDPSCVFHDLLVRVRSVLSEWLNDIPDSHLLKDLAALRVHA